MTYAAQTSRAPTRKLQFAMLGAAIGTPLASAVAEVAQAYAVTHAPEFSGPEVRIAVEAMIGALFVLAFGYPAYDRPNQPIGGV